MHIAVTGARGSLGEYVVAELVNAGYTVRAIDRIAPNGDDPAYRSIDVRDYGQVLAALDGCDAVVHLAAIPSPVGSPADLVFATNALGTFHVLEAAATLGITRVASVSSSSALGVAYRTHPVELAYVPVDEAHPLLPQDVYGLSKQVGEASCAAFHRRTGGVAVSLRFPMIWNGERETRSFAALAEDEYWGAHTLWSYIDIRDAARACRLALEAPGLHDEAFYLAAPYTFAKRPSAELAREYFPAAEIRGAEGAFWGFHDCTRAVELLGFTPEHVWPLNGATGAWRA